MGALDEKIAVVTGAGRGIGRAEAVLLAAEGATVVVNDVDAGEATAVVAEIKAVGGRALVHTDDVSTWAGAESAISTAVETFGRLDILVNNAGFIRDAMSFSRDETQWDAVMQVYLKGHFACAHFAGMHWRERAKGGEESLSGRIINTASESGLYGLAGQVNFAAAKAGTASMTIVLGRELKKYGVTVNAIAPRARTRMTETVLTGIGPNPDGFDEWDPANIAPVVAWLAPPQSQGITGQVFVVFANRLHLMDGWQLHDTARTDGAWTIATLDAHKADLFGDRKRRLPPMGFGG